MIEADELLGWFVGDQLCSACVRRGVLVVVVDELERSKALSRSMADGLALAHARARYERRLETVRTGFRHRVLEM